jgi:hypothetical protein
MAYGMPFFLHTCNISPFLWFKKDINSFRCYSVFFAESAHGEHIMASYIRPSACFNSRTTGQIITFGTGVVARVTTPKVYCSMSYDW